MSAPATPDMQAVIKSFSDLKASLAFELPGEGLITALIQYAGVVRTTMDPALRTRLDAVSVQQIEDLQKIWRGLFVRAGILQ